MFSPVLDVPYSNRMVAGILIILVSAVLLLYWFRYTCLLLLRNEAAQPYSGSEFSFRDVQARLLAGETLDPLHAALRRDYQVLTFLLQHAPALELESIEDRLLVWDYKLMQAWYRLMRIAAPAHARRALSEMASVIAVLAGKIGERAGIQART
jgi:hypothetical protein